MSAISSPHKRRWPWVVLAALVVVLVGGLCLSAILIAVLAGRGISLTPAVAIVRVQGEIVSGPPPSPWAAGAYSERIIGDLKRAEEDRSVKAIVLWINSPGGSVVGSDEVYRALRRATKPIVAVMSEVAASGGYYIACGADYIVANPNTLTGSIGAVAVIPNAAELFNELGIEAVILRSGPRKAEGSIFEKLSPEAKEILQHLIDEAFTTFMQAVAEGRGLETERVRALADGRVYSGQQALELGLVDALGDLKEAVDKAKELGGIKEEPRIIDYRPAPSIWDALLFSLDRLLAPIRSWEQPWSVPNGPVLEYRYVVP